MRLKWYNVTVANYNFAQNEFDNKNQIYLHLSWLCRNTNLIWNNKNKFYAIFPNFYTESYKQAVIIRKNKEKK